MKYKLTVISLALILAVIMTGCSHGSVSVEFTCDEFTKSQHITHDVSATAGDEIEITLCSNPTTGFKWGEVQISDPSVLKLVNREFIAPDSQGASPKLGTSGSEVFTFKVVGSGRSTAKFEYSQPWEGGEKGAWSYTLSVGAN